MNGKDLDGNACPLPTYNAYPCPVICVRNVEQCPQNVRPSPCGPGESYCVDGNCYAGSCPSDLRSFCACFGAPDIAGPMYPCSQDQTVSIPHFDAHNKTAQSLEACQLNAGISIGSWAADAQTPVWNTCPASATAAGLPDFTSPFFLAMWVFYASLPVLNILWTLYKLAREKVIIRDIVMSCDMICNSVRTATLSISRLGKTVLNVVAKLGKGENWKGTRLIILHY